MLRTAALLLVLGAVTPAGAQQNLPANGIFLVAKKVLGGGNKQIK